jgi:hypothetical protein
MGRVSVSEHINKRGNTVIRDHADADRYLYDFKVCTPEKGWQQYDTSQDARYFGVWVNKDKRLTFTYCEGDCVLVKCPTEESYKLELADMAEFYGESPPAFVTYEADGTRTEYYDTRPE